MSFDPNRPVEVHVCYGHEGSQHYPHWLLSLRTPNATKCTWIHSIGGPSQNKNYECSIQAGKSVESRGIASTSFQGNISARDVSKVIAAAKRVEPQQCQMYVVAVIAELEKKGLLPQGRTAFLKDQVQISDKSCDYRREHPVSKPAIAYTQSDRDDFYGHRK